MRGEYRAIHAAITTDPMFIGLSRDAKLLWFILKLRLGASGIAHLLAHQHQLGQVTGMSRASVDRAKQELRPHWLLWEGDILWLRNGLRWEPKISLVNANHRKGVMNHLSGLPVQPIVRAFCEYYELDDVTGGRVDAMSMAFECPSNAIPQQEVGKKEEGSRDSKEAFGDEFEGIWPEYPSRGTGNSNPKKLAKDQYIHRRREGIPFVDLAMALAEYANQIGEARKDGTEGVMQGKTFFGRNDRWVEYLEAAKLRTKRLKARTVSDRASALPLPHPTAEEIAARDQAVADAKKELAAVRKRKAAKRTQQEDD